MLANLNFTFEGDRRPGSGQPEERIRPYLYPRPRRPFQPFAPYCSNCPAPPVQENTENDNYSPKGEGESDRQEEQPVLPIALDPDESKESPQNNSGDNKGDNKQETDQGGSKVNLSEKVINTLGTAEVGLNSIRGYIELAKTLLDDFVFKLDGAAQIVEIMRINEDRRINPAEVQAVSHKTKKDTVDELLELLQTPAFQNVVRQFIISAVNSGS